jgi:PIN domain nuclease of toxin-antitoxin system
MRLLLDTHVFLWFITADPRLPEPFKEAILDIENEAFLSVASFWEIVVKNQLGKLPLPESPGTYIPKERELHQIWSLPILESHLVQLSSLPLIHRDPFDRILICQAIANEMTIATVDPIVKKYEVVCL